MASDTKSTTALETFAQEERRFPPRPDFAATANAIVYQNGTPAFVDCDDRSWNIDPVLLEAELDRRWRIGKLPRAVITVDLYGQCADYEPIVKACSRYDVPVLEDAAEALGATYRGRMAGRFGTMAAFSFNGNKIITTSGGGMLASDREDLVARARYLSSQAREPRPEYHHSEIGFNYRLSNVLAAIGRAQLRVLRERVEARRLVFEWYRELLAGLPGLTFMPEAPEGRSTRWLTCIVIEREEFGATTAEVRAALEAANIEARPVWKPLHLQPVFSECQRIGGNVAERLFSRGLCLPSGSSLARADVEQIAEIIRAVHRNGGIPPLGQS